MARSRKKRDYLEALDDPNLSEDRWLALKLVSMARAMMAEDQAPRSIREVAREVTKLKETLQCLNCGTVIYRAVAFCDQFCQQQATVVRHVRKALTDGRIEEPDIQVAVGIRLWMLVRGGYPSRGRSLFQERSGKIFTRDEYTCQLCGKRIDRIGHLSGDASDSDKSEAARSECNLRGSLRNICPAVQGEENDLEQILFDLAQRISAPVPILFCDDHENWKKYQSSIRIARRRLVQERKADEDGDFGGLISYPYAAMQKGD